MSGPTADSWKIAAARAVERAQHLPRGSVTVDTSPQGHLEVLLGDPAVRAIGWYEGRYGEAEILQTVLTAWHFVPARLSLHSAELVLDEGDERMGALSFPSERLDGLAPRRR
jgi:hypothetical protein